MVPPRPWADVRPGSYLRVSLAPTTSESGILRVANASGFYGDRLSAAREMVEGGPIDVLTGDYLAELTMAILHKSRQRRPGTGYATTFLRQMEEVLGRCVELGIKVVANAGGLNPAGLAEELDALANRLGVRVRIAYVRGDDLLEELPKLQADGYDLVHLDTGQKLDSIPGAPLTANAYLGGWGISEALSRGADVVICPRVTDASLVVGPAAWHFGWARDARDRLAGAVVAGHILECGAQCTGGNYAFFGDVPGLEHPGFPIAELHEDGSCVITKHPGTGGLVSIGTVTAQLLYEIGGPRYANPDVVARFDTIRLADDGPDRVRVSGVRGEPAPPDTKVCINYDGGYRNTVTFVLAGLDIEKKAALAERSFFELLGGREQYAEVDVQLRRPDRADPASNDEALAYLRVTVKDPDEGKVGRAFSNRSVEMTLASYPGFMYGGPPSGATSYAVYWPTLVPNERISHEVVIDGESVPIETTFAPVPDAKNPPAPTEPAPAALNQVADAAPTEAQPLGRVLGARSGDKGGNANVGFWARTPQAYRWMEGFLTVERLKALIPEARNLRVKRYMLPNILAVNFVVHGLLGEGVASSTRSDPQAKTLGEYARAKIVPVPAGLLD